MGILSFAKKQFIDVIDWTETSDGVLAYQYPMADREIRNGAQLTVRESQIALFVNEGEIADLFEPGLHTLETKNLPVLTTLRNWDKLFRSPFKSDVYFFSTRDQLNQKWGTATPVVIRDKEFGPIRVRAYGTYSYRIKNPKVFYQKVSGTRDLYTTEDLEDQLRSAILTSIAAFFGSAVVSFVDMAANQEKFSQTLKDVLTITFAVYGLQLQGFFVQSISLPEELQKHLDAKSQMSMVGDLQKYAQFQAADSIQAAASNPGGMAGAGAGMGLGISMGQTIANAVSGGGSSGNAAPAAADPIVMLGKLHELLTQGILTQAEFDAKKAELLKHIG
jgi:membrane protease subunit (stomatin/prohibitin family)